MRTRLGGAAETSEARATERTRLVIAREESADPAAGRKVQADPPFELRATGGETVRLIVGEDREIAS